MSRYFINDSYYFITVPTIDRYHFFNTPEKKLIILDRIDKAKQTFGLDDFDFSIISNHYHFISYFKSGGIIPKILQMINGGSAYYFNKLTGNKRPIWDEYHIYLIKDEELLLKVRGYIVGNPLKHREVMTFEELKKYPFSSYRSLVKDFGEDIVQEFVKSVILLDDKEFIRHNLSNQLT